jgi:hypothetical protein
VDFSFGFMGLSQKQYYFLVIIAIHFEKVSVTTNIAMLTTLKSMTTSTEGEFHDTKNSPITITMRSPKAGKKLWFGYTQARSFIERNRTLI